MATGEAIRDKIGQLRNGWSAVGPERTLTPEVRGDDDSSTGLGRGGNRAPLIPIPSSYPSLASSREAATIQVRRKSTGRASSTCGRAAMSSIVPRSTFCTAGPLPLPASVAEAFCRQIAAAMGFAPPEGLKLLQEVPPMIATMPHVFVDANTDLPLPPLPPLGLDHVVEEEGGDADAEEDGERPAKRRRVYDKLPQLVAPTPEQPDQNEYIKVRMCGRAVQCVRCGVPWRGAVAWFVAGCGMETCGVKLVKGLSRAMSRALSRALSRACEWLVKGLSRAMSRGCQGLVKGLSRACQGLCQGVVKGYVKGLRCGAIVLHQDTGRAAGCGRTVQ